MSSFLKDRKHLINKYDQWNEVKIIKEKGQNILLIPNLALLAGYFGYLKYKLARKDIRVYCRGEQSFHKTTKPKLFRDNNIDDTEINNRKSLIDEICSELPSWYRASRFKKEDVGPLLQHYGISTYWLDLVDNIFTAVWFALFNNEGEFGYVKFFVNKNEDNDELIIRDLRENHSSLSLRLHCQHGISARRNSGNFSSRTIDLSDFMVAMVRIPVSSKKDLKISKTYMFPNADLDNTLKYLRKSKFFKNVSKILNKYGYSSNFLGEVK